MTRATAFDGSPRSGEKSYCNGRNIGGRVKVSSRAHYGLRAMTELAKSHGRGPLALSEIARVESMPQSYLEQLVAELRKAGLVEGLRGLHGGYTLTRNPA